jgi:hypothetical protein
MYVVHMLNYSRFDVKFKPFAFFAYRRRLGTRCFRLLLFAVAISGTLCFLVGVLFVTTTTNPSAPPTTMDNESLVKKKLHILTLLQQSRGVRIDITATRPCMEFNGKNTTRIYLRPKPHHQHRPLPQRLTRGGFFFDAYLKQEGPEITETYLLWDRRAYFYVTGTQNQSVLASSCLSASQLPPLDLVRFCHPDDGSSGYRPPDCQPICMAARMRRMYIYIYIYMHRCALGLR